MLKTQITPKDAFKSIDDAFNLAMREGYGDGPAQIHLSGMDFRIGSDDLHGILTRNEDSARDVDYTLTGRLGAMSFIIVITPQKVERANFELNGQRDDSKTDRDALLHVDSIAKAISEKCAQKRR
jgi:hypothetical protein